MRCGARSIRAVSSSARSQAFGEPASGVGRPSAAVASAVSMRETAAALRQMQRARQLPSRG